MALRTLVKINHITNLSDARYCAGMGVDLLGFSLEQDQPHYIDPQAFAEITDWVSGPGLVGEFENYNAQEIAETLGNHHLDMIELTEPGMINEVSLLGKPMILKMNRDDYSSADELMAELSRVRDLCEFVRITSDQETTPDPDILEKMGAISPLVISFGITLKNLDRLIGIKGVRGLALDGQPESKVGFKDYDYLADILEALESEED